MEAFDTAEDRAFRNEVRAFFDKNLPDNIRCVMLTGLSAGREISDRWHKILLAKGWAAPNWPKEHGGAGWSLKQQYIFDQERAAAWAPLPVIFNIDMVGPLFIRYGTPEQNARFLPRVLSAEDHWCQGFSEPGSGSDLASLKCRAVRQGDSYVINGAKLWQTAVYESNMMFGLFRTDSSGKKQQGISVLVLPMNSKGLSLRPVVLLDGMERVAQCTFEDVEVPAENLIGPEGQGWGIAKYLLTLERLGIAEVAASRACLSRLKALANAETRGNEPLFLEPTLLNEIAALEADLDAVEATEYEFLFDPQSNGELGPESSILKIQGTLIRQRLTELTMRVAGPFAQETGTDLPSRAPDDARTFAAWATRHYLNFRKISIYGGSNEIQRNIVAKAVLGLEGEMTQQSYYLGEDQRIFRESLQRWLEEHASLLERRRLAESDPGFSRAAWAGLAEMGALGAFLPERVGGAGGGGLELMVAMEAFGRSLFASPYLWTVALAGPLLAAGGSAGDELLGKIAAGKAIVSVALTEHRSRYDLHHVETRARRKGAGYAISGAKRAAPYAAAADFLIVPARVSGDARDMDGISLFLIRAGSKGLTLNSYATADGGRAADLTLGDVELDSSAALGEPGRGLALLQRAVDLAILAQAAEAVGSMRKLLDSTVAYAKTRAQFGVTIGSFQALQHRMVDMFSATEMAASHVQAALARVGALDVAVDPRDAVMVKLQVDKAARLVGQEAIQIHGGMGMTDDLDVGHHFKRLTMMALTFADQGKLNERYRDLQGSAA